MRILLTLLLAIPGPASAALLFFITEEPGRVVATVSGSFDLNATQGMIGGRPRIAAGWLAPSGGGIAVGSSAQPTVYLTNVLGWTAFGSGPYVGNLSGDGDKVLLYADGYLGLPQAYASGSPVSGTATFSGTFSSLGLIPGTYLTVLDSGLATDTITIDVIPEPCSCFFLAIGALPAVTRRRSNRVTRSDWLPGSSSTMRTPAPLKG